MSRKITELDLHTTPASADQVFVHDALTGKLKRMLLSTLFAHVGGGLSSDVMLDFGVLTVGLSATTLTFDVPFADTNYVFFPLGVKDGQPVDVAIGTVAEGTKTAGQIGLTAASADTEVYWIALGRT